MTAHRFAPAQPRLRLGLSLLFAATLAACGGGGGGDDDNTTVSQAGAEASSAAAVVIPNATAEALSAGVSAAEDVIAGDASATIDCPGGGTAVFTVTGPDEGTLNNHRFDEGENFTITYTDCSDRTGAASATGEQRLHVTEATDGSLVLETETNELVVLLRDTSLTLNGEARISKTVLLGGDESTTTWRLESPRKSVTIVGPARTRTYTLSDVDILRSVTTRGDDVTARSGHTEFTFSGDLPHVDFSFTVESGGTLVYGDEGLPVSGHWSLTLPNNAIEVNVVDGIATIEVDRGKDGTVDATYTVPVEDLPRRLQAED